MISPKKAELFKNRAVQEFISKENVQKALKNLQSNLRNLCDKKEYQKFVDKALSLLEGRDSNSDRKWLTKVAETLANNLLIIFPAFASSGDKDLHDKVQDFYYRYLYIDPGEYAKSMYHYIIDAYFAGNFGFIPEGWVEEVFPQYSEMKNAAKKERRIAMISPKKAELFKNRAVQEFISKENVQKALKNLPFNLRNLCDKKEYQKFVDKALSLLEGRDSNSDGKWLTKVAETLANNLLIIFPAFASSGNKDLHDKVQDFYYRYLYIDPGEYGKSMYDYIIDAYSAGNFGFISEDWVEEVFPEYSEMKNAAKKERRIALETMRNSLKSFTAEDSTSNKLEIEEQLGRKLKETKKPRHCYFLLDVTLDHLMGEGKTLYKLDDAPAKLPGVYLIYYIGTTELYEGSKIHASDRTPVYVGMSTEVVSGVSGRLATHRKNIGKAARLTLSDFAFKVIFLDVKHYAPAMEGMLIEHFKPVWNQETVGLSFGSAANSDNMWNRYHIQQHEATIKDVLSKLRIADNGSESVEENDSTASKEEKDDGINDTISGLEHLNIGNTSQGKADNTTFAAGSYERFLYDMEAAKKQSKVENKAYQQNMAQLKQNICSAGLQMRDGIPDDGNCLFHAVADQMERLGESGYNHTDLRLLAVETLREGNYGISKNGISKYVPNNDLSSYLTDMSGDGFWGDHIVLVVLAHALSRTVVVVSSLVDSQNVVVEPDNHHGEPILLGHLSEIHYVSLEPVDV